MKPLTLNIVNRAVRSLAISVKPEFYETSEQPYHCGVLTALDFLGDATPREAEVVVTRMLRTICPPLCEFDAGMPPVGVVIARVNEALRRDGWIE